MKAIEFDAADEKHRLSRFGDFDHGPSEVLVHEGDLDLGEMASGANIITRFGLDPDGDIPFLVVTGDLKVGCLDLDLDVSQSFGLLVMGALHANVVRLEMTMLFVFGGAVVKNGIFFETNCGTLSIAGRTVCPLTVVHEGDFNLRVEGILFDNYDRGPLENDDDDDDDDDDDETDDEEWPFMGPTMTRAEAKDRIVAELWDAEEESLRSEEAFAAAVAGKAILRT